MATAIKTAADFASRLAAVRTLVEAHRKLEDKPTGVIWLSTRNDGIWLLEVIPSMPPDPRAHEPMEFLPSKQFRYTLRLLTGREEDFLEAIDNRPEFAAAVADGRPIPKVNSVTKRLQSRAQKRSRKRNS